jgi:hypothetical protein
LINDLELLRVAIGVSSLKLGVQEEFVHFVWGSVFHIQFEEFLRVEPFPLSGVSAVDCTAWRIWPMTFAVAQRFSRCIRMLPLQYQRSGHAGEPSHQAEEENGQFDRTGAHADQSLELAGVFVEVDARERSHCFGRSIDIYSFRRLCQ